MRRITVWCLGLLVLARAAAAASPQDAAAWMGVKGATAELVAEPVFGGSFMLYRAGARGGEPVVLIHGLGPNGAHDWANVVSALAARHEVFAVDLPGFGLSDKRNELYSPEHYAAFIEKAVAPRVGRPFTLVGHSMGAAIALGYAAAHRERVKRLVLADMAGILQGPVYAESLAKFGIGQMTGMPAGAPWLDTVLGRMIARIENMPISREMILRTPAMRQNMLRGDPNLIAAFALGEHDFSEALRTVAAPTLLIWGNEDRVAPLRTAEIARALIPGARLELIANAGHTPQADDPARFNALVLEHLQGRTSPREFVKTGPLGERIETCDGKTGARYNGDFRKLTLIRCPGARIHHARIGELRVLESDVEIVNSEVQQGLYALRARVELTAGSVAGEPALQLQETEVDAAGTRFEGRGPVAANLGETPVTLRLSVTEMRRPGAGPHYVHDTGRIGAGKRG
jgi:pimeloyl-ACP methyl ester carboxylesterase